MSTPTRRTAAALAAAAPAAATVLGTAGSGRAQPPGSGEQEAECPNPAPILSEPGDGSVEGICIGTASAQCVVETVEYGVWVFIVFEPTNSQGYVPAYTVEVEDMAALPPCSAQAPA